MPKEKRPCFTCLDHFEKPTLLIQRDTQQLSSSVEPCWHLCNGECGLKQTFIPKVFVEPTVSLRCQPRSQGAAPPFGWRGCSAPFYSLLRSCRHVVISVRKNIQRMLHREENDEATATTPARKGRNRTSSDIRDNAEKRQESSTSFPQLLFD